MKDNVFRKCFDIEIIVEVDDLSILPQKVS